jgi:hypothetical protein
LLLSPPDPSRRKVGIADKRKRWALQPALDPSLKVPSGQRATRSSEQLVTTPIARPAFARDRLCPAIRLPSAGKSSRASARGRWLKHHGNNRMPSYFWLVSSRLKEPVRDDVPYTGEALRQDLLRVRNAWEESQASRDRDAIYGYLTAVFNLVAWWTAEHRALERATAAFRRIWRPAPQMRSKKNGGCCMWR